MTFDTKVKYSGSWRAIQTIEVKSGGSWRLVFALAPSVVVAATKLIEDIVDDPSNAEAKVKVDADGDLYAGTPGYSSYETWLDSGYNTQVWVQRTIVSGSLDTDSGSGVLACTTDRVFGTLQTVVGTDEAVIDLKFYSDSGGINLLDTQRVTLHAEVQSGA